MSEVTNGGEKDRQWLAGVRGQVGKAGGGVFLHHMTIRKLIVLSEECLDRRAADEGAVTVEGFVAPAVFTLRPEDHYTQLEVLENSDEWSAQPVTVKIWRRP